MVELAELDKQRALLIGGLGEMAETDNLDIFIEDGAACYQRMLAVLHGATLHSRPRNTNRWLKYARKSRKKISKDWPMIQGGREIEPTDEDVENIDRVHPELSWTGQLVQPVPGDEESRVPGPTRREDREAAERLGVKLTGAEAAAWDSGIFNEDEEITAEEIESLNKKYGPPEDQT